LGSVRNIPRICARRRLVAGVVNIIHVNIRQQIFDPTARPCPHRSRGQGDAIACLNQKFSETVPSLRTARLWYVWKSML
jgi:hypothetical protein